MSSTNRGGVRQENDLYETPSWCVRRLLEVYRFQHATRFLEPCAGSGKIVKAFNAYQPGRSPEWTMVELRENCREGLSELGRSHCPTDFLEWAKSHGTPIKKPFDAVITNPPFALASEFIRASLALAPEVAMLLRLNYWPHLPDDVPGPIVLPFPDRPSFTADLKWKVKRCAFLIREKAGKAVTCDRECDHDSEHMAIGTDSCEYAWLLWVEDKQYALDSIDVYTKGRGVLRRTPLAERKAG